MDAVDAGGGEPWRAAAGQLIVFADNLRERVAALEETAFLLTVAWPAGAGAWEFSLRNLIAEIKAVPGAVDVNNTNQKTVATNFRQTGLDDVDIRVTLDDTTHTTPHPDHASRALSR